jgi:hypothetical protein
MSLDGPEISHSVASGLLTVELDLAMASLVPAIVLYRVEEADFFRPPRMQQYSVGWDLVLPELRLGEVVVLIKR